MEFNADKPPEACVEFRFFGSDLTAEFHRLTTALKAKPFGVTHTTETFIVSRLTIDSNVTIDDQQLHVKVLKQRNGVLEVWAPYFTGAFPITSLDFADHVAAPLGANIDVPKSEFWARQDVLDLCARQPSLVAVDITQSCQRFSIQDGLAEIADLTIGEVLVQSIAFISSREDVVKHAVRQLGVPEPRNVSFPSYLQRLLF